ncbi:MAG: prepilin-type N-terminal cleavage/methylation domain-containing protein [Proteobacteria bacterium]|nr:prepilin-type N-terminal cleavage/methylation domain-containing protein [Pseudomonadota bacterium]
MRRGFTLIEVLVAAAVLSIGCLGLLAMLTASLSQRTVSRDRTQATLLAEGFLAQMTRDARSWTPLDIPEGTHLETVLGATAGSWRRLGGSTALYTVNGVVDSPPAGRFQVGVFRRQGVPGNPALTGAIRVAWARNSGVDCDVNANFAAFDTAAYRRTDLRDCDFITLPFAFTPAN